MKILFLLICLLLACPSAIQAQPLPERAPFRGLVVDQTGKPVAGATLTLRRKAVTGNFAFWGGETVSARNGEFLFPDAESGAYFLAAEAPGFAPLVNIAAEWKPDNPVFRVVLFQLTRAIITLQKNGAPIANISVFVQLWGEKEFNTVQKQTRTDEEGKVVFDQLLPGNYQIRAKIGELYGVISQTSLLPSALGHAVTMEMQRGAKLRAKVTDMQNRSLGGAAFKLRKVCAKAASDTGVPDSSEPVNEVAVWAVGAENNLLISREGEGTVEIEGIPPGRYIARFGGLGAQVSEQTVELHGGETTDLSFALSVKRAQTLILECRDADQQPAKNREVWVRLGRVASPTSIPIEEVGDIGLRRGRTDENGRLSIYPVWTRKLQVWAALARSGPDAPAPGKGAPVEVSIRPEEPTTASIVLSNSP